MKLRDLNIGTQLALGLGCILLFVILLGVQSYQQEEALWQETKGLYEHPLQVRRALGELNGDILIMHRGMKDLVLTDNGSERQQIIQEIETAQANAFQKFDILYDRYLGNRSDIDTVHTEFVTWKPIRDETIRLLREGKRIEAASRTKSSGVGGGPCRQYDASSHHNERFLKTERRQVLPDSRESEKLPDSAAWTPDWDHSSLVSWYQLFPDERNSISTQGTDCGNRPVSVQGRWMPEAGMYQPMNLEHYPLLSTLWQILFRLRC